MKMGVGAHSTQVDAEADCNNTHEIIPMEVQQQQPISDHRSIVDWATNGKNGVVVVDRSVQVVLSTEPSEKYAAIRPINRAEKKDSSTRPESRVDESKGNPVLPAAVSAPVVTPGDARASSRDLDCDGAALPDLPVPTSAQLEEIIDTIKDKTKIEFTHDAARKLFDAGLGNMEQILKSLKAAGCEYRRRKGSKDRVRSELGWFTNAVTKGFVPVIEDKYQDLYQT